MTMWRTLLAAAVALLLSSAPALPQMQLGSGEVLGNSTASRNVGQAASLTAMFNRAFSSTQGTILYRNATVWTALAPGTAGLPLVTGGAGANPSYAILGLSGGGTNAALTASNGGIFYSTATAGAILAGTATARQMLQSGASAAPAWSTTTWPATTTINRLLWSSAASVISDLATANNGVLVTDGSGVPSIGSTLPNAVQDNITRLGTVTVGLWNGTIVTPTFGGTGSNLSATGGASQVLKQASVGGNVTVGTLACADLSDDGAFCAGTDAANLTGTVASARLSGSYTGITGVGTLTAGTLGSGFTAVGVTVGGTGGSTTATSGRYLKGNGSTWATSSGSASGTGACSAGQFVTTLNSDAAPTCDVPAGGGDVTAASNFGTDNVLIRSDGTTKGVQSSAVSVADTTGSLSRVGNGGIPVQGTNSNDDAAAGYGGEYATATLAFGSATSLVASTGKTITSISLTAGDWDVSATGFFEAANTTVPGAMQVTISLTNNTLNQTEGKWITFPVNTAVGGATDFGFSVPRSRISTASTITVYLVTWSAFSISTMISWGNINARRVR